MDREADLIPSSPTISSVSSSDLDTESTGSFFPDRSTTLGTLMGVTFPDVSVRPSRVPSQREQGRRGGGDGARNPGARAAGESGRRRRRRGGRSWWRLCRDEMGPTSLGDFLQIERSLGGVDMEHGHFLYGGGPSEHEAVGAGPLFEDGRVIPPPPPTQRRQHQRAAEGAGAVGRLPVLLSVICSGGEG